jgi:hypothetical protein
MRNEMHIKLINVTENPDGSGNVDVKYDKEGMELLIERGVLAILEDFIKQKEKKYEPQSELGKTPPAVIQPNKRNNTKRRNKPVL